MISYAYIFVRVQSLLNPSKESKIHKGNTFYSQVHLSMNLRNIREADIFI